MVRGLDGTRFGKGGTRFGLRIEFYVNLESNN
jgi:hypothetical protein